MVLIFAWLRRPNKRNLWPVEINLTQPIPLPRIKEGHFINFLL